jgi:hypothetical protein
LGRSTNLVTLESAQALAALDAAVGVHAPRDSKLPELDSLVETATDQVSAIGCECNRVYTVLVAIRVLQTLHQVSGRSIPYTNALVQRTGSHVVAIRRHSDGRDSIFNAKSVDKLAIKNIPKTHSLVSTARGDVSAVAGEVQGVDVLLMSREDVLDGACVDIPDLKAD